jgi:hypothetical protein
MTSYIQAKAFDRATQRDWSVVESLVQRNDSIRRNRKSVIVHLRSFSSVEARVKILPDGFRPGKHCKWRSEQGDYFKDNIDPVCIRSPVDIIPPSRNCLLVATGNVLAVLLQGWEGRFEKGEWTCLLFKRLPLTGNGTMFSKRFCNRELKPAG